MYLFYFGAPIEYSNTSWDTPRPYPAIHIVSLSFTKMTAEKTRSCVIVLMSLDATIIPVGEERGYRCRVIATILTPFVETTQLSHLVNICLWRMNMHWLRRMWKWGWRGKEREGRGWQGVFNLTTKIANFMPFFVSFWLCIFYHCQSNAKNPKQSRNESLFNCS